MWSLRDGIQSWSFWTQALSVRVSNYLIWISFGGGPFVTDLFITCQRALPPVSPGGPCIKGEREQRGNSISWPQTREAPAAFPPLLVSIYRWVNLLTDVPAWRTSTSSLRYLMVAPSAQHGYARHMLTPCGAAHKTWVSGKRECLLAAKHNSGNTVRSNWKMIEKFHKIHKFTLFITLCVLLLQLGDSSCSSTYGTSPRNYIFWHDNDSQARNVKCVASVGGPWRGCHGCSTILQGSSQYQCDIY